jgi:hypothetical protein
LGIEVPTGEDPLLYFLRKKPAAHCEYFASAAALLLRAGRVPARYVTGLVPAEWNPSGRYWVARNRDAHAWVEAHVESQGWVTVEATPAEGVPSTDQSSTRFAWWEALQSDWRRVRAFLSQGRWNRLRAVLSSSGLGVLLGLFVLALATYLAIRIPWPWRFRERRPEILDPGLAEMQQLLKHVDQQLIPHGLQRGSGETLHQFAQRIQEWDHWRIRGTHEGKHAPMELPGYPERAVEWYHAYANFRYRGKWDKETLEDLRSRLPQA